MERGKFLEIETRSIKQENMKVIVEIEYRSGLNFSQCLRICYEWSSEWPKLYTDRRKEYVISYTFKYFPT